MWEGINELRGGGGGAKSQVDYYRISRAEISGLAKMF